MRAGTKVWVAIGLRLGSGLGFWVLGSMGCCYGLWVLGSGVLGFGFLGAGFCSLGFWVPDSGFWGLRFWFLGFRVAVVGCLLWTPGSWLFLVLGSWF